MFGIRKSICWIVVISLGTLSSIRLKITHDENVEHGLVWGGWSRGYYHPQLDKLTPPAPNYYKVINLKPGTPMNLLQQRCNARIATVASEKKKLTRREKTRYRDIVDGCHILTVDYERCYYDARKGHRDGLWEGYYAECEYLEDLGTRQERVDRRRENWIAQGFDGDALEVMETAEAKRDDLRLEKSRQLAYEALA